MYKVSKLAAGSVIAASAALGGASVALADGYAPPRVAYERPTNWSGVYFGVSSGYQWSSIDATFINPPIAKMTPDHDSPIVGAHLGVQHQFGAVVLGVEAGWVTTFRDRSGSSSCNPLIACIPGLRETAQLNDILTIGGRAGWAAGKWLPYITGGYADGRFGFRTDDANGKLIEQGSTRQPGWYLGGGVEWAVSPGWTAGVEYRHYEFENRTFVPFTSAGVAIPFDTTRVETSTDSVAARVTWRWGREALAPLK